MMREKKIADSLVNGKVLKIEGGNFMLCDDLEKVKCEKCFGKRRRHGRRNTPAL